MNNQRSSAGVSPVRSRRSKAGKYLTFSLAGEEYGLEILKVRQVSDLVDITVVPRLPPYIKGVISSQGKVIPVVDLRLRLGIEETPPTPEACVIVVEVNGMLMGIIVDRVSEIIDLAAGEIEDALPSSTRVNSDFILGVDKAKGSARILLAIDKVLSDEELAQVGDVA